MKTQTTLDRFIDFVIANDKRKMSATIDMLKDAIEKITDDPKYGKVILDDLLMSAIEYCNGQLYYVYDTATHQGKHKQIQIKVTNIDFFKEEFIPAEAHEIFSKFDEI